MKYWKQIVIAILAVMIIFCFVVGFNYLAGIVTMISGAITAVIFQKKKSQAEQKLKEVENIIVEGKGEINKIHEGKTNEETRINNLSDDDLVNETNKRRTRRKKNSVSR